jgi:hypothetical protein
MSEGSKADQDAGIRLTADIAAVVNGAAGRRLPLAVSYVDGEGKPHLSLRGTVQVHAEDQLALWSRHPGLPAAIDGNPHVALLYHDLANRTYLEFTGRAHVADDPQVRDRVFDNSPPNEQAVDPERTGVAIVVDVDSVRGRLPSGRVEMAR